MTSLNISSSKLTRGEWTNALGDGDRNDDRNYGTDMTGVNALANGIRDNGALSVLSLKNNNLCNKEAGKALAQALAGNTTLRELDVSCNQSPAGDYSARDGPGFAEELAVGIRDNGAISSVNLLKNYIPVEQAKALASILKEHPTLKSLCGNIGEETELDMSGKEMGAGDAIMLAPEIAGNGALTSLNLASNSLGTQGAKIIAAVLPKCM
jgi:hypothetical protein